jgi:two-component system sensor kinase FixL
LRWEFRRYSPYLVAFGAMGIVVAIRVLIPDSYYHNSPFLLALGAVVLTSIYGGTLPGLVCTGVALILAAWRQSSGFVAEDLFAAALFCPLAITIACSGGWLRRSRARAAAAVEHLREREAHLQSILDTVPDAMIVIDERGSVQSFSKAAERMFGWTAGEAIGRNISMLMPSPDREAHNSYLARYLETGEQRVIGKGREVLGRRKDGSIFPMELHVGETRSHRCYFTGIIRDLTARNESEARLRELQSELTHVARFSAMGEMASTLAHELNQPLSAIANYLKGGILLLRNDDPDLPRTIDAIDKAADQALRAGQIIHRLREFVGRGEIDKRIESLSQLIDEAIALTMVGPKSAGVRIQRHLDPALDAIFADRVQIQQVMLNLIRNSVDAMEQAPRQELTVSTRLADGDFVLVSFTDTGTGLRQEVSARLFQPFITTKPQGMGVGLSISREIIKGHGGRIWAENNPVGGATFHFTLPLATELEHA